jgi:putative zinc finger protein
MSRCNAPAPWEALVAYWAGDLPSAEEQALEEHLIGCAACSAESARVAAITETLRAMIPAVVDRALLQRLRAQGVRIRESVFAPGDRRDEYFTRDVDMLVFRLGGLDLSRAETVEFAMRDERSGKILTATKNAAFDRDAGAVLVCCQRHYADLPPDVVVEVRVHEVGRAEQLATYTILHHFE